MFKRNLFSIIVVLLFILTNSALGATIVKVDSFDSTFVAPFDSIADETIVEDNIIDTNTNDKSYTSYTMGEGTTAKLLVKNLKLNTAPRILATCPLNTRSGVLYTGKADNTTLGISKWYSMAGAMYNFDSLCDTLAVSFSYLNTRPVATGKVVLVMQEVDENNEVLWEKTFTCGGYSTLYQGKWRNLSFTKERLASYLGGHKFNRVWLVEAELYLDKVGGGYFDDVVLTATNSDPEPDPSEDDRDITPPEDPIPGTTPEEEDIVTDIADDIMTECPCNANWRNHGQYIVCVTKAKIKALKKHQERLVSIAMSIVEAAKSNCGKK